MKKILAASALILGLAASSMAVLETGITLNYPISVIIATDAIMLQGETAEMSFGNVAVNLTYLSNNAQGQPRSTVKQIGYASPIAYTARAAVTAPWTLSTARGANIAVLYGAFTRALRADEVVAPEVGRTLVAGDFEATDILNATAKQATATILGVDAETPDAEFKGTGVLSTQSSRSLRYRLDTPSTTTVAAGTKLTITVTLGGVAL